VSRALRRENARFLAIRDALRAGTPIEDRAFDAVYPAKARWLSGLHWTPIEVARCATRLLVERPGARILDIGSGVGKFCIVAAATSDARVSGVEQREHLVAMAERAMTAFGVDVAFEHGRFEACAPESFDGFYLFNPFAEQLSTPGEWIDATIEHTSLSFLRHVARAEELFERARVGTRVVTYCGFGGTMPPSYTRVVVALGGKLELWVKTAPA
jgi:hypothetical protein